MAVSKSSPRSDGVTCAPVGEESLRVILHQAAGKHCSHGASYAEEGTIQASRYLIAQWAQRAHRASVNDGFCS